MAWRSHLAWPVVAVEMADEPLFSFAVSKELLLCQDIPIFPMPALEPLPFPVSLLLHLADALFSELLHVVMVKLAKPVHFLVQLVFHVFGSIEEVVLHNLLHHCVHACCTLLC